MNQDIWYYGVDDYIKCVYTPDPENKLNNFEVILQDTEFDESLDANAAFMKNFRNGVPKKIELLFSGGLDSEFVLNMFLKNNLPVECITMEINLDGITINTHDLYYTEKISREKGVKRKVVSLNAKKFFEEGLYKQYLHPYRISIPHNATHLWLMEQCDSFPVLAGDYHWGWNPNYKKLISPQRHSLSNYARFMKDNNISGISNMIGNCQELNFMCIKEHMTLQKNDNEGLYDSQVQEGSTTNKNPPLLNSGILLKKHVYEKISNTTYEPRLRSYGWENLDSNLFDRLYYRNELLKLFGDNSLKISWGENLAKTMDTVPGSNTKFN